MEHDILIRSASLEDIPLIRDLASVIFPQTYREILSPEQTEYMMDWMYSAANLERQMKEQMHKYFIAEYGGIPCGYLSLSREGVADGHVLFHLQKIYVLPAFQGRHIGSALFSQALEFVRDACRDYPVRIELNVNRNNTRAVAYYKAKGMSVAREGDFPIGNGYYMNDYIMQLDI